MLFSYVLLLSIYSILLFLLWFFSFSFSSSISFLPFGDFESACLIIFESFEARFLVLILEGDPSSVSYMVSLVLLRSKDFDFESSSEFDDVLLLELSSWIYKWGCSSILSDSLSFLIVSMLLSFSRVALGTLWLIFFAIIVFPRLITLFATIELCFFGTCVFLFNVLYRLNSISFSELVNLICGPLYILDLKASYSFYKIRILAWIYSVLTSTSLLRSCCSFSIFRNCCSSIS